MYYRHNLKSNQLNDMDTLANSFGGGSYGDYNEQPRFEVVPSHGREGTSITGVLDIVPGLGTAVNIAMTVLPAGGVKNFLSDFTKHPVAKVLSFIKGKTYTMGDYALGEMYMRNVLGMNNIQNRHQVPDGYVPQSWLFFTTALGVRMRTNDDLDALYNSGSTYLQREPEQNRDISFEAANRAHDILHTIDPGHKRDQVWPLPLYGSIPYIYPIPGIEQETLFTGLHPVTGQQFTDGYPDEYTGPRYVTQISQALQPNQHASAPPPSAAANPVLTTDPTKAQASISPLLLLLGAGALLYGVNAKKSKSVHGSKKDDNTLLLLLAAGGIGALYLFNKNKNAVLPSLPVPTVPLSADNPVSVQPRITADPIMRPPIEVAPVNPISPVNTVPFYPNEGEVPVDYGTTYYQKFQY